MLVFGLESGSQRVLDRMHKGICVQDASRILHDCAAAGIFNVVMVFVGFPGETVQDAQATARFLEEHASVIGAWGVGSFSLLRGSPAFVSPEAFEITWIARTPEDGDLGHSFAYRTRSGIDSGSASRIAAALRRRMSHGPANSPGFPRELIALRVASPDRDAAVHEAGDQRAR